MSAVETWAGGSATACEPKERGECFQRTCGAPDEASDPAVWGLIHEECLDERGPSLQGSSERSSWGSCSGRSCRLKKTKQKLMNIKYKPHPSTIK